MAVRAEKARYIPFRKRDIIRMLLEDGQLATDQTKHDFGNFCHMVESIFHFEFHQKLEKLKDCYFPVNPDVYRKEEFTRDEESEFTKELFETLEVVLNDANYDAVSHEEIAQAYESSATLGVRILIDMDDFEFVRFYSRGKYTDTIERRTWRWFKKETVEFEILERVVLLVKFKPKRFFDEKKRKNLIFEPGSTMIKLFKDVPAADLEILFPNSRVSMSLKDKLLLVVPAIVAGVPLMASKVLPALIVVFLLAGAYLGVSGTVEKDHMKQAIAAFSAGAALGGFLLKQWMKYKNKRYQFQKELSDNLYFRNLVNNVGVFHSLVDSAEEEECKEAFLAYYFLTVNSENPTETELDGAVEKWFEEKFNCDLDFECDDALQKLKRLNLLQESETGRLSAPPLQEALRRLDEIWDNFFQFNKP